MGVVTFKEHIIAKSFQAVGKCQICNAVAKRKRFAVDSNNSFGHSITCSFACRRILQKPDHILTVQNTVAVNAEVLIVSIYCYFFQGPSQGRVLKLPILSSPVQCQASTESTHSFTLSTLTSARSKLKSRWSFPLYSSNRKCAVAISSRVLPYVISKYVSRHLIVG